VTDPLPVRPAATVLLLRDGPEGPEVLMQRRSLGFAFVGGFWVFPGGALDPADRDPAVAHHTRGWSDEQAAHRLDLPAGGLAYWAAGVRECFEEAGVLLARHDDGSPVELGDPAVAARFADLRGRLHRREVVLADVLDAEGLHVATDDLAYVAHWVTPAGNSPRRFDTRFFVARLPHAQDGSSDGVESIDTQWVRPREALARAGRAEWMMVRPTLRNLLAVDGHADVASVLARARARVRVPSGWDRLTNDEGNWPVTGEVG